MSKELKVGDKVKYIGSEYRTLTKGVIDSILPQGTYRYSVRKLDNPLAYPCSADELEKVK